MDMRIARFNLYLLGALLAVLAGGCQTAKQDKVEATVLRVHAEATDNSAFTREISMFKNPTIKLRVDDSPLLTEDQVASAAVVNALGGFALVIKFDPRGQWLLDQHTSLNLGKHFAVFVQYGKKPTKAVWLAAPIISNRISDGALIFTPDVSREDAEIIAQGLGHKTGLDKPMKDDQ